MATDPGSVGRVTTNVVRLAAPLSLDSGRVLREVDIAYETYGKLSPARDNVILVCHALSGDAHAAGWSDDKDAPQTVDGFKGDERGAQRGLGWWDGMIGPGKAFDTDTYHVICTNLIGGCRGSTGPSSLDPATGRRYGPDFPVITVGDMVHAQRAFLRQRGIERVVGISGGSLGGMQALEWAVSYPDAVEAIIPIASTAHLGAQGIAWNAIARNAIMADPEWAGGRYLDEGRVPRSGVAVARMVGHVTYLSAQAMVEKFGRSLQDRADISYTLENADFAVESYLRYQGESFVARFDANSYLYISRALTYFDLARTYGGGSLERALQRVRARTLLVSFSSDWLYPPSGSREIEAALRENGKTVEHHELDATYGHDSFLLEEGRMTPLIQRFLADTVAARERREAVAR